MASTVLRYGSRSVTVTYQIGVSPDLLEHADFLAFPAGEVRDLLTASYASREALMLALSEAGMVVSVLWSRGELGYGLFTLEGGFPNFEAGGSSSIAPEIFAAVKFALPYSASE